MNPRRFAIVLVVTVAVTAITAMVGLVTNVASTQGRWPAFLEPLRQHPWQALGILVALAVVLGMLASALSQETPPAPTVEVPVNSGLRRTPAGENSLPLDISTFTGRDESLRQLTKTVMNSSDEKRVMVIHAIDGMAGVGKTALAVHAAHLLADRFPDGQLFIDLHAHTPGLMPIAPADALARLLSDVGMSAEDIPTGTDVAAVTEQRATLWRSFLVDRAMLLVLDNAAGSEQVKPLLPSSASCMVLITSRRRLTALPARTLQVDTLPPAQAIVLFVRLTGRQIDHEDKQAVADLVQLCGYLPLAITLLAGQLRQRPMWSVMDLLRRLRQTHDRLGEMHAEHLAVAAAFDLSYRYLPADRRDFFRLLGIHPGVDIDAYAGAALAGSSVAEAQAYLDHLYNENLLVENVVGRYGMHDLIGEYARRLADEGDAVKNEALVRLFDYYQHAAARASRQLNRHSRTDSIRAASPQAEPELSTLAQAAAWLGAERANLLACLAYVTNRHQPAQVIGFTAALAGYLRWAGPWDLAITLHTTAVESSQYLHDQRSEATALNDLGTVQRLTGDYSSAMKAQERALVLYREIGDRLGGANALNELGIARRLNRDYPAAAEALEQALAVRRDLGDRVGEATTLNQLGVVWYLRDEYSTAASALEQAIAIYRDLGDGLGKATALNELGTVRRLTGDYPAAAMAHEQALALYHDFGDRRGEANVLNNAGMIRRLTGDYASALVAQERALALYQEVGDQLGEAETLNEFGDLRRLTGDYPAAALALDKSLAVYRALGDRLGEAEALNSLAYLHLAMSDTQQALYNFRRALQLARAIYSSLEEARSLEGIGQCALHINDTSAANANLSHALELYQRMGAVVEANRVRADLTRINSTLTDPE